MKLRRYATLIVGSMLALVLTVVAPLNASKAWASGFTMSVVGATTDSLTIDWGDLRAFGDVRYVELTADGISNQYVNATVTRWTQKRLAPNTTYNFTGKLFSNDGSLLGTATASGTTQPENSAPVAPPPNPHDNVAVGSISIALTGTSSSSLSFSWTHSGYTGNIVGGYVVRLIDKNGNQVAAQNVGSNLSTTFSGLPASSSYSINVNATVRSVSGKNQITLVSGLCTGTTAAAPVTAPAPVAPAAPTTAPAAQTSEATKEETKKSSATPKHENTAKVEGQSAGNSTGKSSGSVKSDAPVKYDTLKEVTSEEQVSTTSNQVGDLITKKNTSNFSASERFKGKYDFSAAPKVGEFYEGSGDSKELQEAYKANGNLSIVLVAISFWIELQKLFF